MEPVLKTGDVERHRGFESLSLRHNFISGEVPKLAVRGSPAKGVGWGDWREGSNPSFSAKGAVKFYFTAPVSLRRIPSDREYKKLL